VIEIELLPFIYLFIGSGIIVKCTKFMYKVIIHYSWMMVCLFIKDVYKRELI